jgi:hypothetical protein
MEHYSTSRLGVFSVIKHTKLLHNKTLDGEQPLFFIFFNSNAMGNYQIYFLPCHSRSYMRKMNHGVWGDIYFDDVMLWWQ